MIPLAVESAFESAQMIEHGLKVWSCQDEGIIIKIKLILAKAPTGPAKTDAVGAGSMPILDAIADIEAAFWVPAHFIEKKSEEMTLIGAGWLDRIGGVDSYKIVVPG